MSNRLVDRAYALLELDNMRLAMAQSGDHEVSSQLYLEASIHRAQLANTYLGAQIVKNPQSGHEALLAEIATAALLVDPHRTQKSFIETLNSLERNGEALKKLRQAKMLLPNLKKAFEALQ